MAKQIKFGDDARKALENAGLDAARLTHILTATCTPDHLSPSLSCIIGGNIGAGPAMSFDFGSACSGFLYGLHLADALLCQDPASQILFVCTEALHPLSRPGRGRGATTTPGSRSPLSQHRQG